MKYIFLLILVLPNVLCFVIRSPRRKREYAMKELYEMKHAKRCKELKMFEPMRQIERAVKDALTNEIFHPVICEENKYCRDDHGYPRTLYYCKPTFDSICLEASGNSCTRSVMERLDCGCHYHDFPEWLVFNELSVVEINKKHADYNIKYYA